MPNLSSFPTTLVIAADPQIPCGAVFPGTDFTIPDRRIIFQQVRFSTPKRIYGLLHGYVPPNLLFLGYECQNCNKIFLVPDTVTGHNDLVRAMRHRCTRAFSDPDSRFDLRTRVLHIVQDIGRPSDLGSVGCEQYADMLMELLEASQ